MVLSQRVARIRLRGRMSSNEAHEPAETGIPPLVRKIREGTRLTVVAVGDLMVADSPTSVGVGFASTYPGGAAEDALSGLRLLLHGADVVFGNLEAVRTRSGIGRSRFDRDCMRADPADAHALHRLGFTALEPVNEFETPRGGD